MTKKSLSKTAKTLSKPAKGKSLSKSEPKAKKPRKTYPAPVAKPKVKGKSLSKKAEPPKPVKHLRKVEKPPPPPRSGPKPVIPKGFKWKGKKHPMIDGVKMVLPENMPESFPKLHAMMVPGTLWAIDPTMKRMPGLVTVMPEGVRHGWDWCDNCKNHCTRCICTTGILHSRSIEWCYIMDMIKQAGEDPYRSGHIDSTGHLVREHGLLHYRDHKPAAGPQQDAAYFRARRAPRPVETAPVQPRKGLSKPTKGLSKPKALSKTPKGDAVDTSKVDIIALANEASTSNDALEATVLKRLANPKKKSLSNRKK
jgi:hypothetical protein